MFNGLISDGVDDRRRLGVRIALAAAAQLLVLISTAQLVAQQCAGTHLENRNFCIVFDDESAGVMELEQPGDMFSTNYVIGKADHPEFAVVDSRWFGDVVFRFRAGTGAWQHASTAHSRSARTTTQSLSGEIQRMEFRYPSDARNADGIRGFDFSEVYELHPDKLIWSLTIQNRSPETLEIGDLGIPLLFNTLYERDQAVNYQKRVIRHSDIAGDNSFIFWTRTSGAGPYLLMTPARGTHLEFFEPTAAGNGADSSDPVFRPRNAWEGLYTAYIHAAVDAGEIESQGTWRQPLTSKRLEPQGVARDSVTYTFEFRWARDYNDIRKILYDNGLIDVEVAPGMVVPSDLSILLALHTMQPIHSVQAEFPDKTTIEPLTSRTIDTSIYRIRFRRLGENELTVSYGDGQKTMLEYDAVEPLETLIQKRATFLVSHQQVKDPSKWYDGLFSLWDMRSQVLRTPDDTGGLDAYMVGGSDDPDLSKAPYIAAKNIAFPDDREIASVEYYIQHFVWGKLQRTGDESPFPYGIYGSPGWLANRNSDVGVNSGGNGQEHLWRTFDYTHLIQLYYEMYRIAKLYPNKVHYLDANGYLDRALQTARAYFRVPYSIRMGAPWGFRGWTDWAYKQGNFHEIFILDLIRSLTSEGRAAEADELRAEWNKKVTYFIYDDPHPFGSEMWFDTTAFESTHAIAKYAMEHPLHADSGLWTDKNSGRTYSHPQVSQSDVTEFMKKEIGANVAARGWLETNYYQLGSDIRQSGSSEYLLSYMTQMGGWSILDDGLYFAQGSDRDDALRLGYASYLAGWALVNSGTAQSNFGAWYPGEGNDGAAGWGFNPAKYGSTWIPGIKMLPRGLWPYDGEIDSGFSGALRSSSTVVVDDPVFGLFAYGGNVVRNGGGIEITCHDGLRQRLHIMNLAQPLHIELDRDGFSGQRSLKVSDDAKSLEIFLESRYAPEHTTELSIQGLHSGTYKVTEGEARSFKVEVKSSGEFELPVVLRGMDDEEVKISRSGPSPNP